MPSFFPDEFLQEVIDRNDIVDVVSHYVKLKRSGSTMKGLCPFHNEKTPSFNVSADKQLFYCFGCAKGGTVINFVMQIENLDFTESVKYLAEKVGLDIPENSSQSSISTEARQLIYKINAESGRFFYSNLFGEKGVKAMEYIQKRQIFQNTVNKFGLGYSLEGNLLIEFLREKGYTDEQIVASGMAGKNDNGNLYDRFRNRLMFPIIDVRKNVIGFGGRVMDDSMPKYLNSPETAAFSKSYNLFGLNFAKASKEDFFILVEGYMDVIALHQNGITNAVATLGTALTLEQARIIKRMKPEVVISYDSDEAGQKATRRAIELLADESLNVRVLTMAGSKDPDEYIKNNGVGAFKELISNSKVQIEYKIAKLKEKYDLSITQDKVNYINEIASEFANIKSPVEREIYANKIASETGVSAESILREVERLNLIKQKKHQISEFRGQPSVRAVKGNNLEKIRLYQAEKILLNIFCFNNEIAVELLKELSTEYFSEGLHRQLFDNIYAIRQKGMQPDAKLIVSQMPQSAEVAEILYDDKNIDNPQLGAKQAVDIIKNYQRKLKLFETLANSEVTQSDKLEEINELLGK